MITGSARRTVSHYRAFWDTQDGHYRLRVYGQWLVVHPGATLSSFSTRRGRTKAGYGEKPGDDYIMAAEDVAKVAVLMAAMPDEVNLYEATILPNSMRSFYRAGLRPGRSSALRKLSCSLKLKTAKALGITVPLPLSGGADELIE